MEQEALEVLRTTPNVVNLKACRPHDEQFLKLSPPTEAPKPPQRSQHTNVQQQQQQQEPQSPIQKTFTGVSSIKLLQGLQNSRCKHSHLKFVILCLFTSSSV